MHVLEKHLRLDVRLRTSNMLLESEQLRGELHILLQEVLGIQAI